MVTAGQMYMRAIADGVEITCRFTADGAPARADEERDDAFNACDLGAVDEVHHPDMVAYLTGLAEPVYGKEAHAAAMQQMLRIFPDMHVYSEPYSIQFRVGDWITVVTNATGTFTGEMTCPTAP
jgi:SnoaL-like polyketide cyclase